MSSTGTGETPAIAWEDIERVLNRRPPTKAEMDALQRASEEFRKQAAARKNQPPGGALLVFTLVVFLGWKIYCAFR
jgi:hypothetical protein